uniref:Uncharacterized protein n=1 Tax=Cannabis sativa TaxID=3483 RepID=A0A803QMZ6_CANSA
MILIRRSSSTESHDLMVTKPNVQTPTDPGLDNPNARLPPRGNQPMVPANVNPKAIRITTPFTRVTPDVQEARTTTYAYVRETRPDIGQPIVAEH